MEPKQTEITRITRDTDEEPRRPNGHDKEPFDFQAFYAPDEVEIQIKQDGLITGHLFTGNKRGIMKEFRSRLSNTRTAIDANVWLYDQLIRTSYVIDRHEIRHDDPDPRQHVADNVKIMASTGYIGRTETVGEAEVKN
jgi:hypothetical protein